MENKNEKPLSPKELVKPKNYDESLLREVESLCGELQNCPRLRRQSGQDIENDDDILF